MICGKRKLYPYADHGTMYNLTPTKDRRYHVCGRTRGHKGKHACKKGTECWARW